MNDELRIIIIDALTEAIQRNVPVTIKNSASSSIVVITAAEGRIILSLSKAPGYVDELIHVLTDALGVGPDLIYNRVSMIKEDFIIYYAVWITDNEESKGFIEQEFSMPQNHITFLSSRAISIIEKADLKS